MEDIEKKNETVTQKKGRLKALLHKAYERLVKIRGQPREIALGFALGLFVGTSPYMGFQTAVSVFAASLLRWNKISAAIGVWISNPVTAPFLYTITYMAGAEMMGIRGTPPSAQSIESAHFLANIAKAPEILWILTLGGIIVGLPIALAGYFLSYTAICKYQAEIRAKLARQKERLARKKAKKKIEEQRKKGRVKKRPPSDS